MPPRVLTPQMVEARTKCSDYRKVVNLNAWGCELTDISICLEMPLLEVLALSVNQITTLASLQNCFQLKQLYLRKNELTNFKELNFLKNCTKLSSLWFDENPCSVAAGIDYRACVLRVLPQIKHLDNIEVSDQELQSALRFETFTLPISPPPPPEAVNPKLLAAQARREQFQRERELEEILEREREHTASSIANIGHTSPNEHLARRRYYAPPQTPLTESANFPTAGDASLTTPAVSSRLQMDADIVWNIQPREYHGDAFSSTQLRGSTPVSNTVPNLHRSNTNIAAAAAAASASAYQARQEAINLFNYHQLRNNAPVTSRSLLDNRMYDMVATVQPQAPPAPSSYVLAARFGGSIQPGAPGTHNLLTAALNLIRDMDLGSLEVLSQAIHNQISSMPHQ